MADPISTAQKSVPIDLTVYRTARAQGQGPEEAHGGAEIISDIWNAVVDAAGLQRLLNPSAKRNNRGGY